MLYAMALLFFSTFSALAWQMPYETCEWTNEDYTLRIIEENNSFQLFPDEREFHGEEAQLIPGETASDIPLECFFASAVRGAALYEASSDQFFYCKKGATKQSDMELRDEDNKERLIYPRRACLSADYIELTARAFNETADCFGFNREEKESIFRLFNHESSFLHNIKSPSGAKCFGQVTTIIIDDINERIYFRDRKHPPPYSHIYDEVIARCESLKTKVLNPELIKTWKQAGGKSDAKLKQILLKTPIDCPLTHDIYSCLFYAFYNIKQNVLAIQRRLERPSSYDLKENGVSEKIIRQFHLPIKLNEMLVVEAAEGEVFVFFDDSELVPVMKKQEPERVESFKALKVPLFANEKQVREIFSYWAYNGGISIATDHLKPFVRGIKESISRPCTEDSHLKRCLYRQAIEESRGLPTDDIKRDFRAYIDANYNHSSTGSQGTGEGSITEKAEEEQVPGFVDSINRDLEYLYNKESSFQGDLKQIIPSLTDSQVGEFQEYIQSVCPHQPI